jgi:hypothetical protein
VKVSWFVLILVLSACAPARVNAPRLTVGVPLQQPSYFPLETGFMWHYLEPGERLDAPQMVRENLGTTRLGEQVYYLVRVYGRQSLTVYYYQVSEGGVFLAREDHDKLVLVYDPPRQVYPQWFEVGQVWRGSSTVRLVKENQETARLPLTYQASVVREQTVTVGGQTFSAFVITFEEQYGDQVVSSEVWVVPFVGDVRTKEGRFLVERNFE